MLGGKVEVPSVMNLRPDQARMLLEHRQLLLAISGEEQSAATPQGQIMRQSPLGGSLVRGGSSIHVTLSKGSADLKVPELTALTLTEAMHQLTGAGLQVGVITRQAHPTVEEGQVISSIPPAGDKTKPGTSVNLEVSTGQEQYKVPKVIGRGLTHAKKALESAGFVTGKVTYNFDEDRRGGIVLRQDPAADSRPARAPRWIWWSTKPTEPDHTRGGQLHCEWPRVALPRHRRSVPGARRPILTSCCLHPRQRT